MYDHSTDNLFDTYLNELKAAGVLQPHPWQHPWHDPKLVRYVIWMELKGQNEHDRIEYVKSTGLPIVKKRLGALISLPSVVPQPQCRWYYREHHSVFECHQSEPMPIAHGITIWLMERPDATRVEGVQLDKSLRD